MSNSTGGTGKVLLSEVLVVAYSASAFFSRYGFYPRFELSNSTASVPDLTRDTSWATGTVGLANTSDEVLLMTASYTVVDALSYGTSTWAFSPAAKDVADGHSLARCRPLHVQAPSSAGPPAPLGGAWDVGVRLPGLGGGARGTPAATGVHHFS